MPTRRLPRTDIERDAALRNGKNAKDAIPALPVIPYTAATITRIDTFQPAYRAKYHAVSTAKNAQTSLSAAIADAHKKAVMYELDFIEALNKAIRREEFPASDRTFYHLDANDASLPRISTESDITTWALNINEGETDRTGGGGAPITFPSLAQVNTAVANFNTLNAQQENAKALYDIAQEELEALNPEADKLILKMWNETETGFDEGDKPSMRRKSRQFGVVYLPNPGEAPSPDDFSMMGNISEIGTGLAVDEAEITVVETNQIVLSDNKGNFFVGVQPPASYTLQIKKAGFQDKIVTNVVVVAGAITTVNAELIPVAPVSTGTVSGQVLKMGVGVSASVIVEGTPIGGNTDPMGNYIINNAPSGAQVIRATEIANPANFQAQNTNVPPGGTVNVNFNLP